MDDIDEDTLNVLLAEGIDAPTAHAAARSDPPRKPSGLSKGGQWFVLLCGILGALYFFLCR